jgi:serine/threonine protein kinase
MSDEGNATVVRPSDLDDPVPGQPSPATGAKPGAPDWPEEGEGAATLVSFATGDMPEPPSQGTPIAETDVPVPVAGRSGSPAFAPPPPTGGPLAPGVVLSSTFEIEQLVARGGMGEVYRARHRITGDPIAIKTIRPELAGDAKIAELFKREAQALRGIRHPAIVSYEGVFDDGTGQLYIAMEFVDGPSLSRLMQNGPLSPADVRRLRDRVADGLAAAHAMGVIHRDLSPDNVILPGGRIDAAKLIDFGIARQTESSKATVIGNDFAGKYSYAAPEQLGLQGGEVGPRADIYSLGLVLAAAATGAPLDMGNSLPSAVQARMRVPDVSRVPDELRAELTAMLQPNPADRPQSMAELVSARMSGRPGQQAERAAPPARSGAKPMIAGIAAAVLVLLGGGGYLLKDQLFPPPEPGPGPGPVVTPTPPGPGTPGTTTAGTTTPGTATPGTTTPATPSTPDTPLPATPGTATPGTATPDTPPAGTTTAGTPTPGTPSPSTPGSTTPPSTPGTTTPAPTSPGTTPATPGGSTVAVAPSAPAQPDLAEIRSRLDALVARFECAELTAQVDGDRMVRLQGYVESEGDRSRLLEAARAMEGVRRVDVGVTVQPWPACELIRAVGSATSPDFRVVPNKIDQPYKIRADRVVFRIYPPAGLQGYLNVVFLNSDRTAWHHEPWSKMRVRPGQIETFGDKLSITLAPPAGKMAIIAALSPKPLFAVPQPEEQPTREYLAALRKALQQQPEAIVSYAVFDTVD